MSVRCWLTELAAFMSIGSLAIPDKYPPGCDFYGYHPVVFCVKINIGDNMSILVFVIVLFGIFWLMNVLSSALAVFLGIPLVIFFITPWGRKLIQSYKRREYLNQLRMYSMADGHGFIGTKKNTIHALQRFVDTRFYHGDLETFEEDQDWAMKKLNKLNCTYRIPIHDRKWRDS